MSITTLRPGYVYHRYYPILCICVCITIIGITIVSVIVTIVVCPSPVIIFDTVFTTLMLYTTVVTVTNVCLYSTVKFVLFRICSLQTLGK